MLSLLSAIAILYYLKLSTTPKKALLIAVILGTHYYANNWGIKSSLAWTVSSFIGSLAIILQFKMRKLSLFLQLIALLFHQLQAAHTNPSSVGWIELDPVILSP